MSWDKDNNMGCFFWPLLSAHLGVVALSSSTEDLPWPLSLVKLKLQQNQRFFCLNQIGMYLITWGKELLLLLPCPCPKISANGAPAEKDSVFNRRPANSETNPGVTLACKINIIHFVSPCVLEQCKKKEPRVNPGGLIWFAAILTLSSHHSLPMKAATSTENEVGSFNKEEGDKPFNERER